MTELERIQIVQVVDDSAWESVVSEWYSGVSQEPLGALRQMRAAAYVNSKVVDNTSREER